MRARRVVHPHGDHLENEPLLPEKKRRYPWWLLFLCCCVAFLPLVFIGSFIATSPVIIPPTPSPTTTPTPAPTTPSPTSAPTSAPTAAPTSPPAPTPATPPPTPNGACCGPINFDCQEQFPANQCGVIEGSVYVGDNTECLINTCRIACCCANVNAPTGACLEPFLLPRSACESPNSTHYVCGPNIAGIALPLGTTCDANGSACLSPVGHCCFTDLGTGAHACDDMTGQFACETVLSGRWLAGTRCNETTPCGSCCLAGDCLDNVHEESCDTSDPAHTFHTDLSCSGITTFPCVVENPFFCARDNVCPINIGEVMIIDAGCGDFLPGGSCIDNVGTCLGGATCFSSGCVGFGAGPTCYCDCACGVAIPFPFSGVEYRPCVPRDTCTANITCPYPFEGCVPKTCINNVCDVTGKACGNDNDCCACETLPYSCVDNNTCASKICPEDNGTCAFGLCGVDNNCVGGGIPCSSDSDCCRCASNIMAYCEFPPTPLPTATPTTSPTPKPPAPTPVPTQDCLLFTCQVGAETQTQPCSNNGVCNGVNQCESIYGGACASDPCNAMSDPCNCYQCYCEITGPEPRKICL